MKKTIIICFAMILFCLGIFIFAGNKNKKEVELKTAEDVRLRIEQIKKNNKLESILDQGEYYGIDWVVTEDRILVLKGTDELNGANYKHAPWESYIIKGAYVEIKDAKTFSYLFSGLKYLLYFDLTDTDSSNVTDMKGMFSYCQSIERIDLTDIDTSNVIDMSYMFDTCVSLKELDISNMNTEKVQDMWAMFGGCECLETINVSSFDTSHVKKMSWMFSNCSKVEELNLSNFNTEKVVHMERMFSGMTGVSKLDISNFDTSNVESMDGMFSGMYSIDELDLTGFILKENVKLDYIFSDSSFKAILVNATWKDKENDSMFNKCEANCVTVVE